MKSSIVFKNIEYKVNGLTILSNVSGVVEVGDKYAIVGDNGSGKSTLLEIMRRLDPAIWGTKFGCGWG